MDASKGKEKKAKKEEGKKGKKRERMAFDTPYGGTKGVRVVPASAEAQSAALAALSRLSNALPGRRALSRALLIGANAVCRVVEAPDAARALAAVCVCAPDGDKSTQAAPATTRSAFGVGSASAVLARHIALCCAQQRIPVAVLRDADSAALGRVAGVASALALAVRSDAALDATAPPLSPDARAAATTAAARLVAAQAAVTAPWLTPGLADGILPLRVAPCRDNPAREPQRQARRTAQKQKQQKEKKEGKKAAPPPSQQHQPPAKKAR